MVGRRPCLRSRASYSRWGGVNTGANGRCGGVLKRSRNGAKARATLHELSDGTLRYLLLAAALLTPRPPALMVLNEPETSLHPDLLPALGRLIAQAAQRSQVLVVSHAARLIATLEREAGCESLVIDKQLGATVLVDADTRDLPPWKWPSR